MLNRLTATLDFQGTALALRSERQRLLASNIANADTPGYLARDIDFKNALRDATGGAADGKPSARSSAALDTTRAGHILGTSTVSMAGGVDAERLMYATASQTNLDGNSVDMDRERASFADNAIKFEATLRFINGNVRTMLDAIKGQS
ncbi:MAG: flagellar basal body rod protein FlgB [Ideonella sp.]